MQRNSSINQVNSITNLVLDVTELIIVERLSQEFMYFDKKFPVILPHKYYITKLIRKLHLSNLHAGVRSLLFLAHFWTKSSKLCCKELRFVSQSKPKTRGSVDGRYT